MTGTWEALVTGQADLAIGVGLGRERAERRRDQGARHADLRASPSRRITRSPRRTEPLSDAEIVRHRAVAVADSAHAARADDGQPAAGPGRPDGQRHAGQDRRAGARRRLRLRARAAMARERDRRRPAGRQGRAARAADGAARLCVAASAAAATAARARPSRASRCAGGSSDSKARRRGRRCSNATARPAPSPRSALPDRRANARRWTIARPREARLRRPLRTLADRPAARRFAGRRARLVARRARARRPLAGADRRPRHAAQRRRRRRSDPRPARPLRAARRRRRSSPVAAHRALRGGVADGCERRGRAYPCACSRRDLALARRGAGRHGRCARGEPIYPGTCRAGLHGKAGRDRCG